MIAIIIIFGVFIIGFVITIIALVTDWRALFQRIYGDDYHHGEMIRIVNGKSIYFKSELWHEGPLAVSYWRTGKVNGRNVTYDDIVPNPPAGVPMRFDANGRRQYWETQPAGVIFANKEDAGYQFTNYSPGLMSSDMFDRTGMLYGTSVKEQGGPGGLLLLLGGFLIILAIAGVLFMVLRPKAASVQPVPSANTTISYNGTAPGYPPGTIIGVPVPPAGGQ